MASDERHGDNGHLAGLAASGRTIAWAVSRRPVEYAAAVEAMEQRVAAICTGDAPEMIWLLEHPSLYTAGTSARDEDLLDADRFPVFRTGRGGQYTYHGPGQRIVYVMMDLKRWGGNGDVRAFVQSLEKWIIASLADLAVTGVVRPDRVGVWVPRPDITSSREDKIAAIGIRVRHWVTFHGFSLNVAPNLDHFEGIVPCGIRNFGVTSLADLGRAVSMTDVDRILMENFKAAFGPISLVRDTAPVG